MPTYYPLVIEEKEGVGEILNAHINSPVKSQPREQKSGWNADLTIRDFTRKKDGKVAPGVSEFAHHFEYLTLNNSTGQNPNEL